MTPAVTAAKRAGIAFELLEYHHDPHAEAYGEEAARALGVVPESVFKTLMVERGSGALALALVPVSSTLDCKAAARVLGAKRVGLAAPDTAERASGYVLGGMSPFGQRRRLPVAIDASVFAYSRVHVSAGRRGLEMALAPHALVESLQAKTGDIARRSESRV